MKKLIVIAVMLGVVGVCWGDEPLTYKEKMHHTPNINWKTYYAVMYQNELIEQQNELLKELIQVLKDSQDPEKQADKILKMLEPYPYPKPTPSTILP